MPSPMLLVHDDASSQRKSTAQAAGCDEFPERWHPAILRGVSDPTHRTRVRRGHHTGASTSSLIDSRVRPFVSFTNLITKKIATKAKNVYTP